MGASVVGLEELFLVRRIINGETDFTIDEYLTEVCLYGDAKKKSVIYHLLKRNGAVFGDDRPDILLLPLSQDGYTVAEYQVRIGWVPKQKETLKLIIYYGRTMAHVMSHYGYVFDDREILQLSDRTGTTVAHEMASSGNLTNQLDLLDIKDKHGVSVLDVFVIAVRGDIPENHPIWECGDEVLISAIKTKQQKVLDKRRLMATSLAVLKNKHLKDRADNMDCNFTLAELNEPVVQYSTTGHLMPLAVYISNMGVALDESTGWLAVRDTSGQTIAHLQALVGGRFPEDHECLGWKNKNGTTVAHVMASRGYYFSIDNPVLYYEDKNKITVAHWMASDGFMFPDDHPAVLLMNCDGARVGEYMIANGHVFKDDHPIWTMRGFRNRSVIENAICRLRFMLDLDSPLLYFKNSSGVTMAELMAYTGFMFPYNHEIFKNGGDVGNAVINHMVRNGYVIPHCHYYSPFMEEYLRGDVDAHDSLTVKGFMVLLSRFERGFDVYWYRIPADNESPKYTFRCRLTYDKHTGVVHGDTCYQGQITQEDLKSMEPVVDGLLNESLASGELFALAGQLIDKYL